MSLDGVIDAPGLVEQAQPYFLSDEEHSALSWELISGADALLLGRKTYEFFAEAYPAMAGSARGVPPRFIDRMNSIPKYVASRTLKEAKWNASIIKGDIAEEVAKLKQQPGQDILKYGTGILDHKLMEHNLIDIFHLYLYPFIFGNGIRFFENLKPSRHLELVETKQFKTGALILTYRCKK
jgi:dihydrofolate reductase